MLKIVPWLGGIMLIIRGFVGFGETSAAAGPLVALIMGILILPPVWSRLPLPAWTRWLAFACGIVAGASFDTAPKSMLATPAEQVAIDDSGPKATRDLVIKKEEWQTGGFGTVGIHSFSVYNRSKVHNYKDVSFTVHYMGASGSEIDQIEKTVFQSFPAGKTVRVKDLNTGFVDQQAQRAAVVVTP